VDGWPVQGTGLDIVDELKHLAKVRVAGSNPVFRSHVMCRDIRAWIQAVQSPPESKDDGIDPAQGPEATKVCTLM